MKNTHNRIWVATQTIPIQMHRKLRVVLNQKRVVSRRRDGDWDGWCWTTALTTRTSVSRNSRMPPLRARFRQVPRFIKGHPCPFAASQRLPSSRPSTWRFCPDSPARDWRIINHVAHEFEVRVSARNVEVLRIERVEWQVSTPSLLAAFIWLRAPLAELANCDGDRINPIARQLIWSPLSGATIAPRAFGSRAWRHARVTLPSPWGREAQLICRA